MDIKIVSSMMTAVLITFMLLQPAFGALSDRSVRKDDMVLFSGALVRSGFPLFVDVRQRPQPVRRLRSGDDGLAVACFLYLDQSRGEGRALSGGGRALEVGFPTRSPTRCSAEPPSTLHSG